MTFRSWLVLVCAPLAACGSSVTDDQAAQAAVTGAGGGHATSTAATSSGQGGGSGGTGNPICGGLVATPCSEDAFCDFGETCGGPDVSGLCTPKPGDCPEDCPGVCGCDGAFYCNACFANAAGVDVGEDGTCPSPFEQYSAYLWFGGLDHLIVRRANSRTNTCLQLFLAAPQSSTPGFDFTAPQEFGATNAFISDAASDCEGPPVQPAGTMISAVAGIGTLSWDLDPGMNYPCSIDVSASLTFDAPPAWVNANEVMQAQDVDVAGDVMCP